jgi:predicted HAD superfamily Cof-like phosphohydrolase
MTARVRRAAVPAEALGAELEATLRQVVQDYHAFVQAGPQGDPKTFTAYHAACRAALAHIDQLLKLLRDASEPGEAVAQEAAELLAKTRAAIAAAGDAEEEGDA